MMRRERERKHLEIRGFENLMFSIPALGTFGDIDDHECKIPFFFFKFLVLFACGVTLLCQTHPGGWA